MGTLAIPGGPGRTGGGGTVRHWLGTKLMTLGAALVALGAFMVITDGNPAPWERG